jgi:hypothetical protein
VIVPFGERDVNASRVLGRKQPLPGLPFGYASRSPKSEKMDLGEVPWIGRDVIVDDANSSVGNKLPGD